MRILLPISILLGQLVVVAQSSSELIPAGSINSTFKHKKVVLVVEDDPGMIRYATQVRDRFFKSAEVITGKKAVKADLRGLNVIVYGTVQGNAWLAKLRGQLPFEFAEQKVHVDRDYSGKHLRVICTLRNPQDKERQVLIYTAAKKADVVGINNLLHGPTQWLVADGDRVLNAGDFSSATPLTRETMLKDLDYLVAKITEVHPATVDGLPADLQAAIKLAVTQIGPTTTASEFWLIINQVLVTLHDAHSSLAPSRSGPRIDLPLKWLKEGLVVEHRTKLLRVGDRIVSIGDKSEADLLRGLRKMLPAENDHWVKQQGQHALTNIAILEALGATEDSSADGPPVQIVVDRKGKSLELKIRRGNGQSRRPLRNRWARWHIEKQHSLGVFVLDRCENNSFYKGTLKAFFMAVQKKKVKRIAVDLRHNSGGNSGVVDEFLRYIDVESYKSYSGEVRISVAAKAQRGFRWDLGYHKNGPNTVTNRRHEQPVPFGGELFIITSSHTFSSGNWFAVVVQDNGMGKVIGEPTGNAPSSYGDILTFTLPASGIGLSLSFKKWVRPDPARDPANSLVPDVLIPLTREDLRDRSDPVLEFLRK